MRNYINEQEQELIEEIDEKYQIQEPLYLIDDKNEIIYRSKLLFILYSGQI